MRASALTLLTPVRSRGGGSDHLIRVRVVRESFAVLRSASSENDSTVTVSAEGDELGSPQHPRARNISWAWAPRSGGSDCRRRRSDNSASIRPVPLRGRRRIILTASASQNGEALPHVPSPGSQDREGPVSDRNASHHQVALDLLWFSSVDRAPWRYSAFVGAIHRFPEPAIAISLIRAKLSLIARFNSLQGRKKFPAPMRRELTGKPRVSRHFFHRRSRLGILSNNGRVFAFKSAPEDRRNR